LVYTIVPSLSQLAAGLVWETQDKEEQPEIASGIAVISALSHLSYFCFLGDHHDVLKERHVCPSTVCVHVSMEKEHLCRKLTLT
jgi:hypothetical protein